MFVNAENKAKIIEISFTDKQLAINSKMGSAKSIISHKGLEWHDFVAPTQADMDFLQKKFKFHPLDCEDCQTEIQRPKIDEYGRYLFIVLHFPMLNPKTRRIVATEVDIFIGQNFLVTIHEDSLSPLSIIREKCKTIAGKREFLSRGSGYFLYELTSTLFDYCFPLLDSLSRTATKIERNVFETDTSEDLLRDIMLLKKDIISFRRILSPERTVVSALEHKNKKFIPPDLEIYFDDVVDKIEKLWGSLDSLKEVAETLQNANESLISHKTGNTIRILTVFSVILLPLTLLTGVFGMNIPLPLTDDPQALLQVTIAMVLIVITMALFFWWKKWL